ncbi:MAG: hypothetical protein ACK5RL_02525 [Acidimicrobiales bacterium]
MRSPQPRWAVNALALAALPELLAATDLAGIFRVTLPHPDQVDAVMPFFDRAAQ